jgi:chemotaxis protein methyltransferase CheR
MSEEEFRLLRDMIHAHCGIHFREELKYLLERRLAPRLVLHGLEDYTAYYRFLRFSPGRTRELEDAVEILTTNETYFFRESYQLRAFSGEILPELHERNLAKRRLRIWSAGCSSGEEPYSIAILVLESGMFEGWDVEIFGNDISRKVLSSARRAVYNRHAFRETDESVISRWFDRCGDSYQLKEAARKLVTFGHLNLLDAQMIGLVGSMDVVFCRNVLIYFDNEAKKRVLRVFYERLQPGGYLLLGHSESLINLSTDYELVHLKSDLVYRRPHF